jgi:hypothetical protein
MEVAVLTLLPIFSRVPYCYVSVLEKHPGEKYEEHEGEKRPKNAKFYYVYKVFEEFFSAHVKAGGKQYCRKRQVEKYLRIKLEDKFIGLLMTIKLVYDPGYEHSEHDNESCFMADGQVLALNPATDQGEGDENT